MVYFSECRDFYVEPGGRNKQSVISNIFFRNRFFQYLNLANMTRSMTSNSTNKSLSYLYLTGNEALCGLYKMQVDSGKPSIALMIKVFNIKL